MAVNYPSDVKIGTGELYYPFRDLKFLIDQSLNEASPEVIDELEDALRRHKTDFLKLFNVKDKNVQDREELKKASMGVEGIFLKGYEGEGRQNLPESLVHESILISDLFDINEFLALDLLVLADCMQDSYPGWGRGLIAVHLFYEGRVELLTSLLILIQATNGNTWNSRVPTATIQLFDSFLETVLSHDLMDIILVTIETKTNAKSQIEKLDANLALGDWRHRSQVIKNIHLIRETLGNIVFCWAAQRGLTWPDTSRLLEFLRTRLKPQEEDFVVGKEHVFLLCAFFYAVDANIANPNFNKEYLTQLRNFCVDCEKSSNFACEEILELIKLTYYVSVNKVLSENQLKLTFDTGLVDEEEFEFKKDMFAFLKRHIFSRAELVVEEEHVIRRFHLLFTDFISYAPMKLKEMKNRSEDSAKTAQLYYEQGITRPLQLLQEYENFLEAMGLFYALDAFELAVDYFSADTRLASLNKLIRVVTVDPPTMFIPNIRMLTGLARSCPIGVFNLVKQNGHNVSTEHFFDSVAKYLASYGNQTNFNGPSLYHSQVYHHVVAGSAKLLVSPSEILGMSCYLDLITTLATRSNAVKKYFATNKSNWVKTCLNVAKVRHLPRVIRAKMLESAAAIIKIPYKSPDSVASIWDIFYTAKIVDQHTSDIREELEEKETRDEQYMLTIAYLKFVNALVDIRFVAQEQAVLEVDVTRVFDTGSLDPHIEFIRDSVLLKASHRSYKNLKERWEMSTLGVSIISKLLDFVPGLMIQLLSDSPLFRTIQNIMVDCFRVREMSTGLIPEIDKCSWHCLNLVRRALHRQHSYFHRREPSIKKFATVIVGIHQLIQRVSPETRKKEYLLAILKFIDVIMPEAHRTAAIEIISCVLTGHGELDEHMCTTVMSNSDLAAIIRHTIANCLEQNSSDELRKVVLKLIRVSIVHSAPNMALFLLGVEKKALFENPGVGDYPRTVLHAILDNAGNLKDAFLTLLFLVRDPRVCRSLLDYLRINQFYIKFLKDNIPSSTMTLESIGHFLRCASLELRSTRQGPLFSSLVGPESAKFIQILEDLDMEVEPLSFPSFEELGPINMTETIKKCEYFDRELKTRLVRIEHFETILRDLIIDKEKSSTYTKRVAINEEAKDLVSYCHNLNQIRRRQAAKIILFGGWRQCLEVLIRRINAQPGTNIEFVSNLTRILVDKVVSTSKPCELLVLHCALTTLSLCSVVGNEKKEMTGMTLNGILGGICRWARCDQTPFIRAHLYCSIMHLLNRMGKLEEARPKEAYFSLIMHNICKDALSQTHEVVKVQAMMLLGEMFGWLSKRGLGGVDITLAHDPMHESTGSHWKTSGVNLEQSASFMQLESTAHSIHKATLCQRKPGNSRMSLNMPSNKVRVDVRKSIGNVLGERSRASPSAANADPLNFFHSKGLLKSIVESLANTDISIIESFSDVPTSAHFRALLVFEAKITLLARFASVGIKATTLLIDTGLLNRLQDLSAFNINFVEEEVAADKSTRNFPPRIERIELIFSSVFTLFHSMLDSAPKNFLLIFQIWSFIKAFNNSILSLLSTHRDFFELVDLFTSLMARLGRNLPHHVVNATEITFIPKLMNILRTQAMFPAFTPTRLKIVRNVIQYLYNHATNVEVEREKQKKKHPWPCRFVLNPVVVEPLLSPEEILSLGAILKIVRDVAQQLNVHDPRVKTVKDALAIIQIGLVISFYHIEIYMRDVHCNPEPVRAEQKKFQSQLKSLTEDTFVRAVSETVKDPNAPHAAFITTLLFKIRKLSHMPC